MRYDPDFGLLGKRLELSAPTPPWARVFVANLPLPLFFGVIVTTDLARVGMPLGILALYVAGRQACFTHREAVLAVTYGGRIVAALQIFPVAQITSGVGVHTPNAKGAPPLQAMPHRGRLARSWKEDR